MSTESSENPFDLPGLCRYFSERSPQPMLAVGGPAHIVRYINPAFAALAGTKPEALIGRPFAEAVPEENSNRCLAILDRVFQTGKPENLTEQEHGRMHASYWSYSMWAILAKDERPAGVMIHVTDATETAVFRRQSVEMNEALVVSAVRQHELVDIVRKGEHDRREMEHRMFQAQKLESLGVLAGGIAHDLNNMLTPVLGYADLAYRALPKNSPACRMLEEVTKNSQRAADLVAQILAYAGKGRFVVEFFELSQLVRDMSGLLGSAVSIHAKLGYDLLPALPSIEGDITQIRQVVLNLVKNASEAIPESGGTITVRTGLIPAADPRRHRDQATDLSIPPFVFLEVTDSGCGMTPDTIEKIFEPFFTTKFVGRGLGLSVVQGIARAHAGTLQVQSEPGLGSTFRVLLPSKAMTREEPNAPAQAEGWRGTGKILVIDDDKAVLEISAFMLRHVGLSVLSAGDGEEGLKVFREKFEEIDVVILDLTMPKMGGLEVATALRCVRPEIPIMLMSGYSPEEATLQAAGLSTADFVHKPFKTAELIAAVRHALRQ